MSPRIPRQSVSSDTRAVLSWSELEGFYNTTCIHQLEGTGKAVWVVVVEEANWAVCLFELTW